MANDRFSQQKKTTACLFVVSHRAYRLLERAAALGARELKIVRNRVVLKLKRRSSIECFLYLLCLSQARLGKIIT